METQTHSPSPQPGSFSSDFGDEHRMRVQGANVRFLVGVALGVLFLFVPFVNVVATPLFLLGGIYMAWKYRTTHEVRGV